MQKWVETEGKGPRKLWCLPLAPRHGHPAWPQECQVQTKKLEVKEEEKEMVALRFIVPKEYVTEKEWKQWNLDPDQWLKRCAQQERKEGRTGGTNNGTPKPRKLH